MPNDHTIKRYTEYLVRAISEEQIAELGTGLAGREPTAADNELQAFILQ